MKSKLVAKIYNNGDLGTAYPIGPNLLMTARHVIEDVNWHDGGVVVEWPEIKASNGKPLTASATRIVFDGEEHADSEQLKCDLAVLYCDLPPEVNLKSTSSIISNQYANSRTGWETAGYPNVNSNNQDSATGQFSVDLEKATIKLTLDDTIDPTVAQANGLQNGWGGMSGAPVFDLASGKIQAIITDHNQWMQKQLIGVSVPYLVNRSQKFREITGIESHIQKHQKFVAEQKRQISDVLSKMTTQDALFKQIAGQLSLNVANITNQKLTDKLLEAFKEDDLAVLDVLLRAGADAFKQDSGELLRQNLRQLFCLFAGLMAPECHAIKQALINLPVRTAMAAELSLAVLYDTNPEFVRNDGKVHGRHTINAAVFTRETGWSQAEFIKDATETIYKAIHKAPPPEPLDAFELEALNSTIKQRQNRSLNQLHRLELNRRDANLTNNPLLDTANCQALNAADCLPDLPIVHYGEAAAEKEAKLSAKLTELFNILESSQPST